MLMARIIFLAVIGSATIIFLSALVSGAASHSGLLLVANKGEHTLGIIDPVTAQQAATVPETGVTGHEVVGSPDGKLAFIPIYGDSGVGLPGSNGRTIDVVDLSSHRIVKTIDFGHGVRPHCAVIGPQDGLLYVTTELDNSVSVIDPKTLKILGSIPTGQLESHMLAISADGKRGYTANVGPGTVSVLDIPGRKTITVIPVTSHVQRISVSPDGHWVFTSDTQKPRLAVINTSTNKVERWIALPGEGYGSAFMEDGRLLVIAVPDANAVALVDLATWQVRKTISVPPSPQEVLVRPDGQVAYVSCDRSAKVAAISADWNVKLIDAGRAADGLAWAK
jgi:YVTN family beta-propeller protein